MEQFLQEHIYSLVHWPWLAMVAVFTIIGQFTSTRLFTRERAYQYKSGVLRFIWYWGRETLPLHPIMAGVVVAYGWPNPEEAVNGFRPAAAYFGSSGVASLFAWMWLKGRAKKQGLDLSLPGMSQAPPEPEPEKTNGQA